jgi:ketosteroid isomerase-like protein
MQRRTLVLTGLGALLSACVSPAKCPSRENAVKVLTEAELAFAKTMADRDHSAFLSFVSDEAIFLNGGRPLRGRAAIGEHWKKYFVDASPPFSWRPDLVEVVESGVLAQSTGPVAAPNGKVVARFYSTWRLEADWQWRVVFDDGYDLCECPKSP